MTAPATSALTLVNLQGRRIHIAEDGRPYGMVLAGLELDTPYAEQGRMSNFLEPVRLILSSPSSSISTATARPSAPWRPSSATRLTRPASCPPVSVGDARGIGLGSITFAERLDRR